MNVKKIIFWGTLIAGVFSCLTTGLTILGLGWKLHRDIISDVTEKQNTAISDLEERLSKDIASKLPKEPAAFQISKQENAISLLQGDIKEVDKKLIILQTSIDSITSLLKKKVNNLTQK